MPEWNYYILISIIIIRYIKTKNLDSIKQADCTIHILGHTYGEKILQAEQVSLSEFQYLTAKEISADIKKNLKIFVWYPENIITNQIEQEQENFINKVRNNISSNMVFTDQVSPIAFVEDIRAIMKHQVKKKYNISETEIFFIYNEIDEDEANEITDLLSDIAKIEKLNVIQNSDKNYSEFASAQMDKAKLSVVYFRKTSDWAIPFVQQIWKKTGGASSKSEILLIGDANVEKITNINLTLPKVEIRIIPAELIPLEIKVLFDKISQQ